MNADNEASSYMIFAILLLCSIPTSKKFLCSMFANALNHYPSYKQTPSLSSTQWDINIALYIIIFVLLERGPVGWVAQSV